MEGAERHRGEAKMAQGHSDTPDATAHCSERMVHTVYDRRRVRVAKPVR